VIDEGLRVQASAAIDVRRRDAAGRPQSKIANLVRGLARCACGNRMLFVNKGLPPKGGYYLRCFAASREDECDNKRLWPAKNVEGYILPQIDAVSLAAAFEPAAKRVGPSPKELAARRIAELTSMKNKALDEWLRAPDTKLGAELKSRAESLVEEIAEQHFGARSLPRSGPSRTFRRRSPPSEQSPRSRRSWPRHRPRRRSRSGPASSSNCGLPSPRSRFGHTPSSTAR
jgi:hypothetical protein